MTVWQNYGIRNGESSLAIVPSGYKPDGTRRLIMGSHGVLGGAFSGASTPYEWQAIVDKTGCVMVVPDLYGTPGGGASWGNDSSLVKLTGAWNAAVTEFNVKSDKILFYGESMGVSTGTMYAIANPTKVAAICTVLPSFNVEDIRANNRSGLQASIEAAYVNNAGWQAVRAARDAIVNVATLNAFPQLHYYSLDDPICIASQCLTYDAQTPWPIVSLGSVGHVVPSTLPTGDIASFLRTYMF